MGEQKALDDSGTTPTQQKKKKKKGKRRNRRRNGNKETSRKMEEGLADTTIRKPRKGTTKETMEEDLIKTHIKPSLKSNSGVSKSINHKFFNYQAYSFDLYRLRDTVKDIAGGKIKYRYRGDPRCHDYRPLWGRFEPEDLRYRQNIIRDLRQYCRSAKNKYNQSQHLF